MHRIENRKLAAKIVDMMTYTKEQQGAILRMYGVNGGINPILYTTESGVKQQLDKFEPGEIGELKVLTFIGGHPKMRKFTFKMKNGAKGIAIPPATQEEIIAELNVMQRNQVFPGLIGKAVAS